MDKITKSQLTMTYQLLRLLDLGQNILLHILFLPQAWFNGKWVYLQNLFPFSQGNFSTSMQDEPLLEWNEAMGPL